MAAPLPGRNPEVGILLPLLGIGGDRYLEVLLFLSAKGGSPGRYEILLRRFALPPQRRRGELPPVDPALPLPGPWHPPKDGLSTPRLPTTTQLLPSPPH